MNQETSNPACFRRAVALWEAEAISNQEALLAPRRKPSLTPVVLVSEPVVVASLSYPDPLQAWVIRFRFWYSGLFFLLFNFWGHLGVKAHTQTAATMAPVQTAETTAVMINRPQEPPPPRTPAPIFPPASYYQLNFWWDTLHSDGWIHGAITNGFAAFTKLFSRRWCGRFWFQASIAWSKVSFP